MPPVATSPRWRRCWCGAASRVRPDAGPWLEEMPGGELMGWATMETRIQTRRLPRVGERVQSFGATVAIHDKVTHRLQWCFGLEDGEVLVGFEIVNLAFDTRSRRPMRIPDGHTQRELATLQPDLAPAPRPERRIDASMRADRPHRAAPTPGAGRTDRLTPAAGGCRAARRGRRRPRRSGGAPRSVATSNLRALGRPRGSGRRPPPARLRPRPRQRPAGRPSTPVRRQSPNTAR